MKNLKQLILILTVTIFTSSFLMAQANTKIKFHFTADEPIKSFAFFNSTQSISFQNIPYTTNYSLSFNSASTDYYDLMITRDGQPYHKILWLDQGDINIYIKIENGYCEIDRVEGSETYSQVEKFQKSLDIIDPSDIFSLKSFLYISLDEFQSTPFVYTVAATYLFYFQNNIDEVQWLKGYLEDIPQANFKHPIYKMVTKKLSEILNEKFVTMYSYTFLNRENQLVNIPRAAINELIILDFWFVNCPPCRKQHKQIKEDLEKGNLHDSIRLIGLSIDDSYTTWKNYLETNDYQWENYKIQTKKPNRIDKDLLLIGYPTYMVLSHDGRIINTSYSYNELKSFLNDF